MPFRRRTPGGTGRHRARPAASLRPMSRRTGKAGTPSWAVMLGCANAAANLFRGVGIGGGNTLAPVLPHCCETVVARLGGGVSGIVNPIDPLLEPEHISAILRQTQAKVVRTRRAFPEPSRDDAALQRRRPRKKNSAPRRFS